MAHGSPRLVICNNCDSYIAVARFSDNPKCPTCKKKSESTDENLIKKKYNISIFYNWIYNFNIWTNISEFKKLK